MIMYMKQITSSSHKNRRFFYFLLGVVKSIHLWAWIMFVLWAIFCYYYPRDWAIYSNSIDGIFAPMEWYFIWMMGVGAWGFAYNIVTSAMD